MRGRLVKKGEVVTHWCLLQMVSEGSNFESLNAMGAFPYPQRVLSVQGGPEDRGWLRIRSQHRALPSQLAPLGRVLRDRRRGAEVAVREGRAVSKGQWLTTKIGVGGQVGHAGAREPLASVGRCDGALFFTQLVQAVVGAASEHHKVAAGVMHTHSGKCTWTHVSLEERGASLQSAYEPHRRRWWRWSMWLGRGGCIRTSTPLR